MSHRNWKPGSLVVATLTVVAVSMFNTSCQSEIPTSPTVVEKEPTRTLLPTSTHDNATGTVTDQQREQRVEVEPMAEIESDNVSTDGVEDQQREYRDTEERTGVVEYFDRLPEDYDPRLITLLNEPIPEDVIVSFYYVAAGRSPHPNYRWELRQDG